ncbi:lipopolysaccharide-induced tumor necrosis factor-alpha factor homolog [Magallana gigas]|uniref:lipopolysaccharide-induced tumor necrosis factor-alpha factor homolog n=1 Tax=Magallana gigas TaxID=29159 RepID=UPI003341E4A8
MKDFFVRVIKRITFEYHEKACFFNNFYAGGDEIFIIQSWSIVAVFNRSTVIHLQSDPGPVFRDTPISMACPNCHDPIITKISFVTGSMTWIICRILLVFGYCNIVLVYDRCRLGCCLIPFYLEGCKDCVHTCPKCHKVVGKYIKQ